MKVRSVCLLGVMVLLLASVAGCKSTPTTSGSAGAGQPSAGSSMPGSPMPGSAPGSSSGSAPGSGSDGTSSGPSGASQSSSAGGENPGSGGSGGKSVEVLDGELEDSLGEFEGKVANAGSSSGEIDILDPTGRNAGGVAAGVPVFEEAEIGAGDVENPDVEERANEGYEGAESENDTVASNGVEGAENIPVPIDVGDGQGDDIVLRQIREAAMKEPDPVLREKLWNEYRRIKGQ